MAFIRWVSRFPLGIVGESIAVLKVETYDGQQIRGGGLGKRLVSRPVRRAVDSMA